MFLNCVETQTEHTGSLFVITGFEQSSVISYYYIYNKPG